jgi:hypothetical protein
MNNRLMYAHYFGADIDLTAYEYYTLLAMKHYGDRYGR